MVLGKMGIEDVDLADVRGWNRLADKFQQLGIDVTVHEPQINVLMFQIDLSVHAPVKNKNSMTSQRKVISKETLP